MESLHNIDTKYDELEERLATQKANLHDLAMMGAVITSIHEIKAVLSVVMEMSTRLVNGEVGVILIEEKEELVSKATWGIHPGFINTLIYRDNQDLATYCFNHRETVILSDLGATSEEGMLIESIICVPIQTAKTCYGSIVIINKSDGGSYTADDQEILELLMSFVAVAIENSILMKERLERQKTEQEMAIAKQVQETLLPQDIDGIKGVEIGAVYFPAREVGGDFYDVVKLDEQRFIVIIGDVSNKGVPAALVMSAAASIIKTTLTQCPDITVSELAGITNNLMAKEIIKDREMFVTLFFSKFDLENNTLTFCNAGHLPGLLWNENEQTITELSIGGPIIGQFENIPFKEKERGFSKGDRLFLFTDGLTEATDNTGHLFGRERAEQVFSTERGLPPKEFCLRVKEWVDRFTEGCSEETVDDFTILQVKAD